MAKLKFRLIPQGTGLSWGFPVNFVQLELKDIEAAGLNPWQAAQAVAAELKEPVAINIYDPEAVTTSSDGLPVDGAIYAFAAGDYGRVHQEFGMLYNKPRQVTEDLFAEEPHLRLLKMKYPGRTLLCGPDPKDRKIPLHNAVMTGRTVNNNSGTEFMNSVTMEEMLLPITGQMELLRGRDVVLGLVGEVISVAVAHAVPENFSQAQPELRCAPGDTIHAAGAHSPKLKAHLPILVAPKKVLARHIIEALEAGLVPMRELSSAPAILAVAHALGKPINWDALTPAASCELAAIGIDVRKMKETASSRLSADAVLELAEEIIPGIERPQPVRADEISKVVTVEVS